MNWISDFVRRKSQPAVLSCKVYDADLFETYETAAKFPTLETGGDLFGLFTETGEVLISRIIGPGPKCEQLVTHFKQDNEFLEEQEKIMTSHGLKRIGSWHSHHTLSGEEPTESDCQEMVEELDRLNCDKFVQMIASIDPHTNKVSVKPFLFYKGSTSFVPLQMEILQGASPFMNEEVLKESQQHISEPTATRRRSIIALTHNTTSETI